MEALFLGMLIVSLLIVFGLDTTEKRRRFLAEQSQ
jgi:hypothetical protein